MNLQGAVSKICDYHEMHNNNLFFERVHDCIDSCLSLLNPYFEIDELVAIEKSKKARMHEDSEQLNGIYHEVSIKRPHFDLVKQKRDYARMELTQ
ncbi:hypothetical protein AC260_05055 [Listeria monocytogenes]|nr:hypothetical protein [Listeria monocytogenes]